MGHPMAENEDNSLQRVQVRIEQQPGGVYRTYSNSVDLSWTLHDVRIRFNDLERLPKHQESDLPTNRIEERAIITLAWSEAKILSTMLIDLLDQFERENTEIVTPKLP
jgi:Protein of unknown function (DUF3467)